MNRYDYKNSIQYKKYCIKELLKIKKERILNKIKYALNILEDIFNFENEIKEDYDLNINLRDYMPQFYYERVCNYLTYNIQEFDYLEINVLSNALCYINKTINALNKRINDLYYTLI